MTLPPPPDVPAGVREAPGPGEEVDGGGTGSTVETHLSVLLFLDEVVCKFKKPIRLPFVDFRSAETRRRACLEEVEANRRLSPDVYLGVAQLRVDLSGSAAPADDASAVIDHAVVMRRLPASRNLATMVTVGDYRVPAELERLAVRLADFHARARRGPDIDDAARPEALAATWRRILDTLAPFAGNLVDGEVLAEVERLAMRYLRGRALLFEQRIAAGRVCDGHGDLRAADVFLLDDGARVLDCIEFDPGLRHVDVAADVAFLAMDLERLGAVALSHRFLDAYQEAAGDRFPLTLVEHYWAERAAVRAEVACLRAKQLPGAVPEESAAPLLAMAQAHLRYGRVVLAVVSGLPGTGKSTVADALAARVGWPVLRSDEIRRELVAPEWRGPLVAARVPGAYEPSVSRRTYDILLGRAEVALAHGQPVILDATFSHGRARRDVEDLALRTASDLTVLVCDCPPAEAAVRIRARLAGGLDVSGADEAVARRMAEGGGGVAWPGSTLIDSSGPLETEIDAALGVLGPLGVAGR